MDIRSNIMMTYESRTSRCGRRVRAPGQPSRPALAASGFARSRAHEAGPRVCGLDATGAALPPSRPTRARPAPGSGSEGRLYGQGPSECAGARAQTGARRRVHPERSREPRPDGLPAASVLRRSWAQAGGVSGSLQGIACRSPAGRSLCRCPGSARQWSLHSGARDDPAPRCPGVSARLHHQAVRASPCSGLPSAPAARPGRAIRERRSSGRPSVFRWWAVASARASSVAVGSGRAATRLCPRTRSTGR